MGRVVALEISKNDMLSKLPSILVKNMEKVCLKRREFFKERLMDTKKVVKQLIKQSEEADIFDNDDQRREYMQYKSLIIQ